MWEIDTKNAMAARSWKDFHLPFRCGQDESLCVVEGQMEQLTVYLSGGVRSFLLYEPLPFFGLTIRCL